ncbi:hypothetical protein [Bounagaea algeriensis]
MIAMESRGLLREEAGCDQACRPRDAGVVRVADRSGGIGINVDGAVPIQAVTARGSGVRTRRPPMMRPLRPFAGAL